MRKTLRDALIEAAEHGSSFTSEYVPCPTCGVIRNVVEIVEALPEDAVEADWLCANDIQERLRRLAASAPIAIEDARSDAWEQIKAARARAERVAPTDFGPFDSDDSSRIKISGKLQELSLLGEAAGEVRWKLADNRVATLTPQQFLAAALAVGAYIQTVHDTSWGLEAQLAAATTLAEIGAVQWPAA